MRHLFLGMLRQSTTLCLAKQCRGAATEASAPPSASRRASQVNKDDGEYRIASCGYGARKEYFGNPVAALLAAAGTAALAEG